VQGSVFKAENKYTQTSGTLTDSVIVAKFIQNASSTGNIANFYNGASILVSIANTGALTIAPTSTTASGYATLTFPASTSASVAGLVITGNNTQTNANVLSSFQLGTSGNTMGLIIQGTGSTTVGAIGTGKSHLVLWANTASSAVKIFTAGNGTSYTETFYILADGRVVFTPTVVASGVATSFTHTEVPDVVFGLNRVVKWVDGTITAQRAVKFLAPTYTPQTTAMTITAAATVYIDAAPIAGTGTTITDSYALWVGGQVRFDGDFDLADTAVNFKLQTTTGTKIGTATTQKLGFWNATPIAQPAAVADASGGANVDTEARTQLNDLLAKLRTTGLIAT
jgi:hypothetical protein